MVFTAYFDESGTHAGATVSTVAGFVADARQWRKYEKRSARLFARCGVKVFHAIDVRRGHGDFKAGKLIEKLNSWMSSNTSSMKRSKAVWPRLSGRMITGTTGVCIGPRKRDVIQNTPSWFVRVSHTLWMW
jgi:hypothetical protein